ncbi:M24 family metallopeptidase, partial [Clostridioides difficile]|uniref:M24 family metallopeptidase n=1 Tax=Clostridioides difficile TaxID=1496 RepID=UPI001F284A0E
MPRKGSKGKGSYGKGCKIYEDLGTDGFSFDPIIGFGPNGANPHGEPGNALVKPGDAII